MSIKVDNELCTGCGTCAAICPASFKMNAENKSEVVGESDCAAQAAESCPEGAITIE